MLKTWGDVDVKDFEWIAKLLRLGLLKASFIPNRNQRELRELVRYRRSIRESQTTQRHSEGAGRSKH